MVGELRAKQIVHLHRLFRVIAAEFESVGMSDERLEAYRSHDVSPNDFKATKVEHEAALMELAEAVGGWAADDLERSKSESRRRLEPVEP